MARPLDDVYTGSAVRAGRDEGVHREGGRRRNKTAGHGEAGGTQASPREKRGCSSEQAPTAQRQPAGTAPQAKKLRIQPAGKRGAARGL